MHNAEPAVCPPVLVFFGNAAMRHPAGAAFSERRACRPADLKTGCLPAPRPAQASLHILNATLHHLSNITSWLPRLSREMSAFFSRRRVPWLKKYAAKPACQRGSVMRLVHSKKHPLRMRRLQRRSRGLLLLTLTASKACPSWFLNCEIPLYYDAKPVNLRDNATRLVHSKKYPLRMRRPQRRLRGYLKDYPSRHRQLPSTAHMRTSPPALTLSKARHRGF